MSKETRLWLPPASLADAEAAVGTIAEEWAGAWFAAAPALLVRQSQRSAMTGLAWRGLPDVRIGSDEAASALIGASVCAGQGDPQNPPDRTLLSEVGSEACDHLVALLDGGDGDRSSSIRVADDGPDPDETCFRIAVVGATWSIGLALGADAMTQLRRRTSPGGPRPELGSLAAALANERCALAVHLGHARLSAGEVAALGKGDVILFNSRTTEPVPVIVAGEICESGSARIEGDSDSDSLRAAIVTPISLRTRKTVPA